jgi:hypothetical protein
MVAVSHRHKPQQRVGGLSWMLYSVRFVSEPIPASLFSFVTPTARPSCTQRSFALRFDFFSL